MQPITVGAWDTVDSVIRRFKQERGVDVTTRDLVDANGAVAEILAAGRTFLLPVNATTIETGVS